MPKLAFPSVSNVKPTIAAMKTAIGASGVAANYSATHLMRCTKNDLIFICRSEGISVAGI